MMASLFNVLAFFACLCGIMVIKAKNPVYSVLFLILVFCNTSGLLLLISLDFFAMIFLVVYIGAIAVLFLFVVMMLNIKLAEINDNILRYLPIGGLFGILFLSEILLLLEKDLVPVIVYPTQNMLLVLERSAMIVSFVYSGVVRLLWTSISQSWALNDSLTQWHVYRMFLKNEVQKCSEETLNNAHNYNSANYVLWPHTMEQTTTIQTLGNVVYTYYMVFFIMASVILLISMIGAIVLTMHKGVFVKKQEVFEQNTRDFSKTLHKIKVLRQKHTRIVLSDTGERTLIM